MENSNEEPVFTLQTSDKDLVRISPSMVNNIPYLSSLLEFHLHKCSPNNEIISTKITSQGIECLKYYNAYY